MKPEAEWGPADYMAIAIGWSSMALLFLSVCLFVTYWLDAYNIWPFNH